MGAAIDLLEEKLAAKGITLPALCSKTSEMLGETSAKLLWVNLLSDYAVAHEVMNTKGHH